MSGDEDILFNGEELDVMSDRKFFPLKRQINKKLYALFAELKNQLKDSPIHKEFPFPAGTDITTGKISQGENYREFPWVILDFPKLFHKEKIFAYRTLFLYGHGFSNSLVVGGSCCATFVSGFQMKKDLLNDRSIRYSLAEDPWEHLQNEENSALCEDITINAALAQIQEHHYFKLTSGFRGNSAEEVIKRSLENYGRMLEVLL